MKKTLILLIACIFVVFLGLNSVKSVAVQNNKKNSATKGTETVAKDTAIELYKEFLSGQISVHGIDINYITVPTGEPDKRYPTKYAFFDSNGDDIPELHLKSARYYYIFSFINNKLVLWKDLSLEGDSIPLTNGAFINQDNDTALLEEHYNYFILNYSGDEVFSLKFYRKIIKWNGVYDGYDNDVNTYKYYYAGTEVSKEQWDELIKSFLYTDNNGVKQISNQIKWNVLYK